MGLLTVTISESMSLISPETTNKWGTFVWGTDLWGGRDISFIFDKYLTDNLSLTDSLSKRVAISLSDSFSMSDKIATLVLRNNHWFQTKDGQVNAIYWPEDRFIESVPQTDLWSEVTPTTTTWVSV